MTCRRCNLEKKSRYCDNCDAETPTAFSKEFTEIIFFKDWMRNHFKSGERVDNKSIREVEQYVGNKDKNVVSEFEKLRYKGKKTLVIHRLWRRFGNSFRKVHEHKK